MALGVEALTMGRAGETILPPTVTDNGGAFFKVAFALLVDGFDIMSLSLVDLGYLCGAVFVLIIDYCACRKEGMYLGRYNS